MAIAADGVLIADVSDEELTKEEIHPIRHPTIEELKSKLVQKDIVESETASETMIPEGQQKGTVHTPPPSLSEDGLIIPRKPPNPIKENFERQNLHRELLFNQKIGKNVLNQKSELQRALEKQKDHLARKELENHIAAQTPELEKVIADRAKRLQEKSHDEKNEDEKVINREFLEARMKLKTRHDSK